MTNEQIDGSWVLGNAIHSKTLQPASHLTPNYQIFIRYAHEIINVNLTTLFELIVIEPVVRGGYLNLMYKIF